MKNSSLEITEQEYLIKLRKEDYDLSFIHQLIKRIQAEQFFFTAKARSEAEDFLSLNPGGNDLSIRFDNLGDK